VDVTRAVLEKIKAEKRRQRDGSGGQSPAFHRGRGTGSITGQCISDLF